MYRPTTSRIFSTSWGSGEILKLSPRCGCNRTSARCGRPSYDSRPPPWPWTVCSSGLAGRRRLEGLHDEASTGSSERSVARRRAARHRVLRAGARRTGCATSPPSFSSSAGGAPRPYPSRRYTPTRSGRESHRAIHAGALSIARGPRPPRR